MIKYVISGVARSGTTALFDLVGAYLLKVDSSWSLCYEPYLWGPATWILPREHSTEFDTNNSIYPLGIYAHTETDLFSKTLQKPSKILFDQIAKNDRVFVKFIRASGRLESILHYDSNIRIVHIIRNPLDVVNSQGQLFSFFGEEFHPSDQKRFVDAVMKRWPDSSLWGSVQDLQWRLEWWLRMNAAAFESAKRYPESIMLISQEALLTQPGESIRRVIQFLCGDVHVSMLPTEKGSGTSVRGKVLLNESEIRTADKYLMAYESEFLPQTQTKDILDWSAFKYRLQRKYSESHASVQHQIELPASDSTCIRVRSSLYEATRLGLKEEEVCRNAIAERDEARQECLVLYRKNDERQQQYDELQQQRDELLGHWDRLKKANDALSMARLQAEKDLASEVLKASALKSVLLQFLSGKGIIQKEMRRRYKKSGVHTSLASALPDRTSRSVLLEVNAGSSRHFGSTPLIIEGVWDPGIFSSVFDDLRLELESNGLVLVDEACVTSTSPATAQGEPWVGLSFTPYRLPAWASGTMTYQSFISPSENARMGQAAKNSCRALIVFSKDHQSFLEPSGLSTIICKSPLPPVSSHWSREGFDANQDKAIVQVGWWLMRPRALQMLPGGRYRKIWVRKPSSKLTEVLAAERHALDANPALFSAMGSEVEEMDHSSIVELECLLCKNIAFAHYLDASAPPLLLECIALHAPILVNRLPAIEECLGNDYPLYYYSYADAIRKAADSDLVQAAHDYLRGVAEEQSSFSGELVQSVKRRLEVAS